MFQNTTTSKNKVWKIISNFFNPLTSLFLYFLYFSYENHSVQESSYYFLPLFLFTALPISLWIFWNVKTGKYSNMDVSDRVQRKSLYFFIIVSIASYLLYDFAVNENTDLIMVFIMILLIAMQISNYFIKSSMHTAFNLFVAALFFSSNAILGIAWFIITIVVGISRVILKRHTIKEVVSGALIAAFISFIYLYTHIQIQH